MKDGEPKITITILSSPECPSDRAYLVSEGCPRCGGRMAWLAFASQMECPSCGHRADERQVVAVRGLPIPR